MIFNLFIRPLIALYLGAECAYPAKAAESVDTCAAEYEAEHAPVHCLDQYQTVRNHKTDARQRCAA